MANARGWQPLLYQSSHAIPGHLAPLASSRERAVPEPAHPEAEYGQRFAVHGHTEVSDVSTYDRSQPLTHLRDRIVPASPKFGSYLVQLGLHPAPHRLPKHRELGLFTNPLRIA